MFFLILKEILFKYFEFFILIERLQNKKRRYWQASFQNYWGGNINAKNLY